MMSTTQRGCFITMEGVDGAGKSTHVRGLVEYLRGRGLDVVATREPGGTQLGEKLRELLLHETMHLQTETLLMFAARCEHLHQVIIPALQNGQWVVCDRFSDASYAYQGGGRQLGAARIDALVQWLHPLVQPDRTWLFDVPLTVARERLTRSRNLDRFEREQMDFFERTRNAYHEQAARAPERFHILDTTREVQAVRDDLLAQADALVQRWAHMQEPPQ